MQFASDNTGPAHPAIMDAIAAANDGYAPGYGADAIMGRVAARLREIFEAPDAAVHLVATGTAANALALACLAPPWSAVFCHRMAHIAVDECGAPEFYTGGAKLVLVEGPDGRIAPEAFERALSGFVAGNVHGVQKGALTLTNATEAGTVYAPDAVRRLCAIARSHGLPVHMDGARFANALAATGATPAEMTWRAGVDAVSFGGTKNGCIGVEAVILFDPARAWEFELRRKRGGHLFSKHRYLSAQMQAYLADGLWLDLAARANASAARLSAGIAGIDRARLVHPTQANAVFAAFPRAGHRRAQEAGAAYYLWPFEQSLEGPGTEPLTARLVCNWATRETEIAAFLGLLTPQTAQDRV